MSGNIGTQIDLTAEELAEVRENAPQVYEELIASQGGEATPQTAPQTAPQAAPEQPAQAPQAAPAPEQAAAPAPNPLIPPMPDPAAAAPEPAPEPEPAPPAEAAPAMTDAQGNPVAHADELGLTPVGEAAPAPAAETATGGETVDQAVERILAKREAAAQEAAAQAGQEAAQETAAQAGQEAPAQTEPAPFAIPENLLDSVELDTELVDAMGEDEASDVMSVAAAVVEKAIAEVVAPLHQRIQELEAQAEGTSAAVWEQTMRARVLDRIPDWDVIDKSVEWKAWLEETDPILRGKRMGPVLDAYRSGDVDGVVHLVNEFRKQRMAARSAPAPASQAPAAVSAASVQPATVSMPTPATQPAQSPTTYTVSQYNDAMDEATRQYRLGNDEYADQIVAAADEAKNAGLITLH